MGDLTGNGVRESADGGTGAGVVMGDLTGNGVRESADGGTGTGEVLGDLTGDGVRESADGGPLRTSDKTGDFAARSVLTGG